MRQFRLVFLVAVVAASVIFGMVLASGLGVMAPVQAQGSDSNQPTTRRMAPPVMPDFAALAEETIPAVVWVFNTDVVEADSDDRRSDPFDFFFGPRQPEGNEPRERNSSGSGFFISPEGEIITNYHVVEGADRVEISFDGEAERFEVEVIGSDPATDIALLKVVNPTREFDYLSLGESETLRRGEWVMAVGNPLGLGHSVTVGVVSAKGRALGLADRSFERYIQTDAAINRGNSGGPLLDGNGAVVGINTAINMQGQNLGFAVPIEVAQQILPQLRETGRVVRGYLGVEIRPVDREIAEAWGLREVRGALVDNVVPDFAAEKAGLLAGDIILSVDGKDIQDNQELIDSIANLPPGTEIVLGISREGKRRTIEVVLDERPGMDGESNADDEPEADGTVADRTGLTVRDLSSRHRQSHGIPDDVDGALVTRVEPLSPAADKGLVTGDVITHVGSAEIDSAGDLDAALGRLDDGAYARLRVFRPRADRSFFVILRLE